MTDASAAVNGNAHEYTVSELAGVLKRMVEDSFGHIRLRGEISGFKRAASGHLYMSLKDDRAVLDAVMWKGLAASLAFRPEDGLEVVVTGKLTTYPGRSKYQIVIDRMEPAGIGALMALLEERKKKLAAEGLFDPTRKHVLPFLPEVIGVVTSPTGAVIRDILHRLEERFPRHVLVWPVLVQGEGAATQIAAAIEGFNRLGDSSKLPRPDLIIVARGGGSLEDLWAFNEEIVVRAAANSEIPLISAVGHETDTTLIDYAADKRAPTPTAAAEMAVPVQAELRYAVEDLAARHDHAIARYVARHRERVVALARALPNLRGLLALPQQRLDEYAERLPRALKSALREYRAAFDRVAAKDLEAVVLRLVDRRRHSFDLASRLLDTLSYHSVLARGFAAVFAGAQPVTRKAQVKSGAVLDIEFADGRVPAVAGDAKTALKKKPPRRKKTDPKQGTLL